MKKNFSSDSTNLLRAFGALYLFCAILAAAFIGLTMRAPDGWIWAVAIVAQALFIALVIHIFATMSDDIFEIKCKVTELSTPNENRAD